MAKDDYEVILYRILVYLYAVKKRSITFEALTFEGSVKRNVENEQYFTDILRMAQDEGLIKGLEFTKAWGNDWLLISDISDAEITAEGIRYIKDNSKMQKIGEMLKDAGDIIIGLATTIGLFI